MLRWVGKYIQTYGKSKCLAAPRWPPTIRSLIFAHDFAILKTLKMGSWANRFDAGEAEAWRWQLQFRLAEISWEYWNDTHPMSSNRAMGNCWNPLQMVFEWEISYKWRFCIAMFGYQMVGYRTVVLVRIFRWLWCLSCPPLFDSGPLATHTQSMKTITCEEMAIWSHKLSYCAYFLILLLFVIAFAPITYYYPVPALFLPSWTTVICLDWRYSHIVSGGIAPHQTQPVWCRRGKDVAR